MRGAGLSVAGGGVGLGVKGWVVPEKEMGKLGGVGPTWQAGGGDLLLQIVAGLLALATWPSFPWFSPSRAELSSAQLHFRAGYANSLSLRFFFCFVFAMSGRANYVLSYVSLRSFTGVLAKFHILCHNLAPTVWNKKFSI